MYKKVFEPHFLMQINVENIEEIKGIIVIIIL